MIIQGECEMFKQGKNSMINYDVDAKVWKLCPMCQTFHVPPNFPGVCSICESKGKKCLNHGHL